MFLIGVTSFTVLWTPSCERRGSVNQGLCVLRSFPVEVFLVLTSYFFLKLSTLLEAHVVLCVAESNLSQKWGKSARTGPKIQLFEVIGKFSHQSFSEFGL